MSQRMRKFIGVFLTPLYLAVYALIVMAIGGQYVVGLGTLIELPFYVFGGLAWIPGAMLIIKWMAKP